MKVKYFTVRSIIVTSALSVIITLGAVALVLWQSIGTPELAVLTGMKCIESRFVGEYDKDALADAALDGMVNSLGDRWSYYADAESYAAMKERRSNSYVGIGITVEYTEQGVYIKEVAEGGSAQAAGLLPGETIIEVDGVSVTGENALDAANLIHGEEGTLVTLVLLDAEGIRREVAVKRVILKEQAVTYEMLEGNIGYIALANFYSDLSKQAKEAVETLVEQGAQSIVFDVRNNPGGYLSELTDLLDYLLPEGAIFQSGTREGPQDTTYSDKNCVDLPMVVLVNADSYSAAELFAAQLKESVGAVIVGQPTCGKGYSQQTFELPGGRALNISTRTYYTGSGVSLIGVGLVPDKVIELTADEDTQLAYALEYLKG